MSSYRRVEPAFCRGCGQAWTPGADACPGCGEALLAPQVTTSDPRSLDRFRAALVVGLLLVSLRWVTYFSFPAELPEASPLWIAILAAPAALALLSVRWWVPGGWEPARSRVRPSMIFAALVVGAALAALAFVIDSGEVMIGLTGGMPRWIALAAVGLLIEEVVFRGVLFDGMEAFGGRTNAAIAVTVLSALVSVDLVLAVGAAAAAALRAWSGSLVPALALRLAWVLGLGLIAAGVLSP